MNYDCSQASLMKTVWSVNKRQYIGYKNFSDYFVLITDICLSSV